MTMTLSSGTLIFFTLSSKFYPLRSVYLFQKYPRVERLKNKQILNMDGVIKFSSPCICIDVRKQTSVGFGKKIGTRLSHSHSLPRYKQKLSYNKNTEIICLDSNTYINSVYVQLYVESRSMSASRVREWV